MVSYPKIAMGIVLAMGALVCGSRPLTAAPTAPIAPEPEESLPFEPAAPTPEVPAPEPPGEPENAAPPDSDDGGPTYLRPQNACPQALEPLVDRMLYDLPTYAGLVASRSLGLPRERFSPFGTVILASQPNYEPIALPDTPYGSSGSDVQQVFFTTLERQYWQGQPISLQHYHWMFLAEAENGWYLSQIYSSVGSYPAETFDAPTPPQETSDGIIGQAVTLWLRDCRAGAVFPPADAIGP